MPWMGTVSARADVGGIGFGDSKRRSQSRDRNSRQLRLNLPDICIFIGPISFWRRKPRAFRGLMSPLSC